MAIGSGLGAKIFKPKKLTNLLKYFFGEDQARYIVEVKLATTQKQKNFRG